MRKYLRISVLLVIGILLAACSSQDVGLDGTVWELLSINGVAPIDGTEITLRFQDGRVQGSSGCNTYGGDYTLENDGVFQAGPIAVTEMACLDPEGAMAQEVNYLQILQGANMLVRDGDELTIEGGGDTLVFWGIFE
jgi:heat shock protein HslJ